LSFGQVGGTALGFYPHSRDARLENVSEAQARMFSPINTSECLAAIIW
jgi:hypothetical protein